MNIDIRTLSIVLSITAVLQTSVILMQYLTNKTYKGIGWWLTGYFFMAISSAFIPLREVAELEKLSIIITNLFQIAGAVVLYSGVNAFFNKKIKYILPILFSIAYITIASYFTFADNNLTVRIINNSIALAAVSFIISHTLFINKDRSISISALFLSSVFLFQGIMFTSRAAAAIIQPSADNFFAPTFIQVSVFIVTIININLWMTGFIIMINQRLNSESIENREHFELIFNTSPDAAIISRLDDGLIVSINDGFLSLSGLDREDVVGKKASEITIWTNPADITKVTDGLRIKGITENTEVDFKDTRGNILSGLVSAKIITLHGIPHVISVARDITLRKKIEDKLIMAIDEALRQKENAEKANKEKELLLREVHHRIKNNMNTIVGLLSIQTDTVKEPSAIAALEDTMSRIRSMMMLYDKLYQSKGFIEISIKEYLSPLVDEIAGIFPNRRAVIINKNIDEFVVNAETLFSLGIIVNELITNMMKYAFSGRDSGIIKLTASLTGDRASVVIQDNGIGMPESIDIYNSKGFGLQLVGMLVQQIGGSINIERDNGTKFTIEFGI
jgi:PAS domain S-box-containing protein